MNSVVGFTNASMMFGIQQMQNAAEMFYDSRRVMDRVKHSLDSISDAMTREMDKTNRESVDRWNRAGMDTVEATSHAVSGSTPEDESARDDWEEDYEDDQGRGRTAEMSVSTGHTTHSGQEHHA